MNFELLDPSDTEGIIRLSEMATEIVREHFDPLIGKTQNDYMIKMFQSVESISHQLQHGYRYYFVKEQDKIIGFLAFFPKDTVMYLSKFYLYKSERGNGYARRMMEFIVEATKAEGIAAIELNVNRGNDARFVYEALGFYIERLEKNDIGSGFFMDDYVYRLDIK